MVLKLGFKNNAVKKWTACRHNESTQGLVSAVRWRQVPEYWLDYSLQYEYVICPKLCNMSKTSNRKTMLVSSFCSVTNKPSVLMNTAYQHLEIILKGFHYTSRFMHAWHGKDRPSSFKYKGLTFVTHMYFSNITHLSSWEKQLPRHCIPLYGVIF